MAGSSDVAGVKDTSGLSMDLVQNDQSSALKESIVNALRRQEAEGNSADESVAKLEKEQDNRILDENADKKLNENVSKASMSLKELIENAKRNIENAVKAERHTKLMQDKYKDQIQASISATKLYKVVWNSKDPDENAEQNKMRIFVEDLDSVAAILKYQGSKTAVLNFASYRSPGGGFIRGSIAQEECLCHESFLYNVLESFQREFYEWNMQHKQKGLYLNRALYSPEIGFFRNGKEAFCDVITCAAPNKAAAQKYENVSECHHGGAGLLQNGKHYFL